MVSIAGVLSTGTAMPGVAVTLSDANGMTATSAPTDSKGEYTLPSGAYVFPVTLVASAPSGTLVSVLAPATAPADKTVATANVTTLTTALAALLTNGQPLNLAALHAVKSSDVAAARAALDAVLRNLLAANGLSATFDPVSDPLVADGTGADAVIDAVSIIAGPQGPSLALAPNGPNQPASGSVPLTTTTVSSPPAPLPVPAASSAPPSTPANYLDYLQKALQDCLALPVAQRSTAARCADTVDPAFKHNGYTGLGFAFPDLVSATLSTGATVALPKTLFFISPNGKNQSVVRIYYTLNDGTQSSFVTHAQQLASPRTLSDGTSVGWDLIGNQQDYDAAISSRLQRSLALDSAAGEVSAYLSGLIINFNPDGPNAANVNSVQVTGPGLPAGGVWLRRTVVCNNGSNMVLMGTPPASPPKSASPINSNTAFYRWDWQPIPSGAAVTPGGAGIWAQSPVDVTTIPLYASYTFTPYDVTGTALASFVKYNVSPPTAAAAGASLAWNTLDPAFVAAFLSPGGASAGAQASATVAWSANPSAAPAQSVYVGASQSTATAFAETDGSVHVAPNASTGTVAADTTTASGLSVSCPGTFSPLQSVGDQRFVQLRLRDINGLQVVDSSFYSVQTAGTGANSLLSGNYFGINYNFFSSSPQPILPPIGQPLTTPQGFGSSAITLVADGIGSFTATGFGNNDGVESAGSTTGTYSITATGTAHPIAVAAATGAGQSGAVLADGSIGVAATLAAGADPKLSVFAKSGSGLSNASVSGKYTVVSFYQDPTNAQPNMVAAGMPMPVPLGMHSEITTFNLDGSGTATPILNINNKDGVATTTAVTAFGYSVDTNGVFTIAGSGNPTLTVAPGGELLLGTRLSGTPVNAIVAVKNGSGMSNASLNGTYVLVTYGFAMQTAQPTAPAPGQRAPAPKGFYCTLTTASFNGAGNVSISQTRNTDGVVTTSPSSALTYSVAADGTLNIGNVQGAVSASGKVLVLGAVSSDPGFGIGVRQ